MNTSLFDFTLPESLIADQPANPRDASRMLVIGAQLQDKTVRDLTAFLRPGDVMVFNDTRVIPARLLGKRGAAKVEVLLHRTAPPNGGVRLLYDRIPRQARGLWQCFAKPAKKLKPGDRINFADDFSAEVIEKRDDGQVILHFAVTDFSEKLARYGQMPLPPYIEKKRNIVIASAAKQSSGRQGWIASSAMPPRNDEDTYQTVYAKHEGSVAAPTAGLHFTDTLLKAIDDLGVKRAHVTLHVGGGTFLPVKVDDTSDHVMHSEWAEISADTARIINESRAGGGRIIAVGTTSLRTLESAADTDGIVQPFSGETNIFITPGYRFKTADMLLTNFHLPKSTLFMLVSAFCGLGRMQAAYAHAIAQKYRFYSYGDACLLMRE